MIYDGDIEADGDSDKDEDWTKSKEGEKLLREDSEDEFMFNWNQCDFDTIWEDQLKHILNGNLKEKRNLTVIFCLSKKDQVPLKTESSRNNLIAV